MLILASRSPQRRAILEQLGLPFEVVEPCVEETTDGEPEALVSSNALRKARSVAAGRSSARVLGADTAVVLDGDVLGKPVDRAQAEQFLMRLAGSTHEVFSGIAICHEGIESSSTAVTRVRMRSLERADITWYLDTEEWRERAGGYAIQGRGAALVEEIAGDFWNVVGLPVPELLRLLGGGFQVLRAP